MFGGVFGIARLGSSETITEFAHELSDCANPSWGHQAQSVEAAGAWEGGRGVKRSTTIA